MTKPGNPHPYAKGRASQGQRGHGTLPMQPDVSSADQREAAAANLKRLADSRPLKPPQRKRPL